MAVIAGVVIVGERVRPGVAPLSADPDPSVGSVLTEHLCEPEVEHLDGSVWPHLDVCRLQVAMDDVLHVGGLERVCDLLRHSQRFVNGQAVPGYLVGERWSFDQFEDECTDTVDAFEAEDVRDVRMVQRCQRLGFALETGEPFGIVGLALRKDFDGDVAVERRVRGSIDFAHPACPEGRSDCVWTES